MFFFSPHFNTTFIFDRLIGQLDGWKLTLQDVGSYLQDQRIFLPFYFYSGQHYEKESSRRKF